MKRGKRLWALVLAAAVILSMSGFTVLAEEGTAGSIPQESDYVMSGGTITGLSASYINSLTAEQKSNIKLFIPGTIQGKTVTAIGNNAFQSSKYSGCTFTELDFSKADNIISIGEWAFYNNTGIKGKLVLPENLISVKSHAFDGCSGLSGSLRIPEGITAVGDYAFSGCKGMQGTLTLPVGMKEIQNYAFYNAGFTGRLDLPQGLTKIGDSAFRQSNSYAGFSGTLSIPDSVTYLGQVSFSYQTALTGVEFLGSGLTNLPDSVFRYASGLTGVVKIPDSVQTIGKNTFADTKIKTVYLPKRTGSSALVASSTFSGCSALTAIVCSKEDYTTVKGWLNSAEQKKLGYKTEITFKDNNGGSYTPLQRLFNLPYNYSKQADGSYSADADFRFPPILGDTAGSMKWGTSASAIKSANETDAISQDTLYAITPLAMPVITYGDGIDKTYDGNPAPLTVTAEHPNESTIQDAEEGDVVFYYTWRWATIGSSPVVLEGYDKNSYDVTDVREPNYGILCSVYVQACLVKANGKVEVFNTSSHDFPVTLKQADPAVTPVYDAMVRLKDGLPAISMSEDDTAGTISWNDGQNLREGTHSYQWTYNPEKNAAGSYNYKTKTGAADIKAVNGDIFDITVSSEGEGTVNPSGTILAGQGEDLNVTVQPDAGYQVSALYLDNTDVKDKISNGIFLLHNIQSSHKLRAVFEKMDSKDMEGVIEQLPDITDGKPVTEEQKESILNAKKAYENLGENEKGSMSSGARDALNNALAALPQITVSVSTESGVVSAGKPNTLLENLTEEDIQILLEDPSANIEVNLQAVEAKPEGAEKDLIEDALNGASSFVDYDIKVMKKITGSSDTKETELSELVSPLVLTFAVPDNLPAAEKGYDREYFVVRVHDDGTIKDAEILKNESRKVSEIVVSTDKFSTYTLAYKDIKQPGQGEKPDNEPDKKPGDESRPSGSNGGSKNNSPQTGDDVNAAGSAALAVLSGMAAIYLFRKRK